MKLSPDDEAWIATLPEEERAEAERAVRRTLYFQLGELREAWRELGRAVLKAIAEVRR